MGAMYVSNPPPGNVNEVVSVATAVPRVTEVLVTVTA